MGMYINNYQPWPPWVRRGNEEIATKFPSQIGTYRGHADRDPGHDMSGDLAADFFLYANTKTNHDKVLAWFMAKNFANAKRIGATYIITYRRIASVGRASEGIRIYEGDDPHTGHFHVSYGTDPPPFTPVTPEIGFPLMATADDMDINYSGPQKLEAEGRVHINADEDVSVVTGNSDGIDIVASVMVEGLLPDESVKLRWGYDWKKSGAETQSKGSEVGVTLVRDPGSNPNGVGTAQVLFKDNLPKASVAGWTNCLRLKYTTESTTAVMGRRSITGWWKKP
jgi:hypothetical protein